MPKARQSHLVVDRGVIRSGFRLIATELAILDRQWAFVTVTTCGVYEWHGGVMSGRRSLIKGYFWRCAGRGCGHVFGLSRGELDPLALMLSADPLPRSEQRA
jgi:hypothetical protein